MKFKKHFARVGAPIILSAATILPGCQKTQQPEPFEYIGTFNGIVAGVMKTPDDMSINNTYIIFYVETDYSKDQAFLQLEPGNTEHNKILERACNCRMSDIKSSIQYSDTAMKTVRGQRIKFWSNAKNPTTIDPLKLKWLSNTQGR